MKPLVMDLGMHNGDDTAYYLSQGYRVVAVEADPMHVEKARKRFAKALESGDLVIEECGITATSGERTFYRSKKVTEWSSFDVGLANRNGAEFDAFTVQCRNPRFLFEQYGIPHYLKVDLEGNDRCVIAALREWWPPKYFSCEIMVVDDIDELAAALEYTEFAVVDQSKYLGKKGCNPSGPFGDKLDAPWVSADEAARQYSEQRQKPLSWFDVHARMAA